MSTLLISNPPRRNSKGRFVKGSTKRRRRSTTAGKRKTTRRRRRSTRVLSNPPRRRRRSASSTGGKVRMKTLIPQAAAGVAGYMGADFGTEWVLKRLPPDLVARMPRAAYPAAKAGVAIGLGEAVRRYGPRPLRKFGPIIALGGTIAAGIDAVQMVRSRAGLSGYWGPEHDLSGYWGPEQLGEASDRMEQMGLSGPVAVFDTEDF